MYQCWRISSVIGQGMEEKPLCFLLLPSNICMIHDIAKGGSTLTQRVKFYSAVEAPSRIYPEAVFTSHLGI